MTNRIPPTRTDYLDAIALCRATHNKDSDAIDTLLRSMDPVLVFQATVDLYLTSLGSAIGSAAGVDEHLRQLLQAISAGEVSA